MSDSIPFPGVSFRRYLFALFATMLCGINNLSVAQDFHRVSMGVTGSVVTDGDIPQISDDGRHVSYTSYSNNIVADSIAGGERIFVIDRVTEITNQASISEDDQYISAAYWHSMSADGRYVAFSADNILVRDQLSNTTTKVNQAWDGSAANNVSGEPRISANGQFVAYWSLASNLVNDDNNGTWDIFVHVVASSQTIRVVADSTTHYNDSQPDVSSDGRFIVFNSDSSQLVAGDTNSLSDVFVHDLQSGVTELVSTGHDGSPANGDSTNERISGDGRYVSYISAATNLVPTPYPVWQIFHYDRVLDTTQIVSLSSTGVPLGGTSWHDLSGNGEFVVFESELDGYVPTDSNGFNDIFRHEIATGITEIASVGFGGGQSNYRSKWPVVSADGSVVAFSSAASNLVDGAYDYNPVPWDYFDWPEWWNYMDEPNWKVYAYDFSIGETEAISRPIQPNEPPYGTSFASISSDGTRLAFASETDNFVMEPENGLSDIFLYDTQTMSYQRIAQPEVDGFTRSHEFPELSEDGNKISYSSRLTDLIVGGIPRYDAFVYDIALDTHTQVNLTQQGLPADGVCLGTSDISATGEYVVFSCDSSDLTPET
jgi:hypothetical protein